jgi:osmotically-inducible protein OsmY
MPQLDNATIGLEEEVESNQSVQFARIAQGAGYLLAAGAGAAAMYFLDPNRGKARRAMCRDKAFSFYKKSLRMFHKKVDDLENRIHGMEMELKHSLEEEGQVGDEKLAARIKAKLGRVTAHVHPIEVLVNNGNVELKGRVLVDEVDRILCAIRTMGGVKNVANHMAMFEEEPAR